LTLYREWADLAIRFSLPQFGDNQGHIIRQRTPVCIFLQR
jgi:hypothetical protein